MMNKLYFLFLVSGMLMMGCSKKNQKAPDPIDNETPEVHDPPASVAECKKCIILSEQLDSRVAIADVPSQSIIWEWKPKNTVKPEHISWFSNMSDAKSVYNGKYILVTASGGGVALVRIADKKTMFYAFAGGNTHSAELLPDGNIVSASSTGNYLTLFKVDTLNFPENVYKKNITIDFGHNVVWDHKNQVLWSAARSLLKKYRYNFDCAKPSLTLIASLDIPKGDAHDLYPVYNENALWLSVSKNVYKFDIASSTFTNANTIQDKIKSVSSGPAGFPTIVIRPKVEWWSDEVLNANGDAVFYEAGLKIYKARWLLENSFSYPVNDKIKQCD